MNLPANNKHMLEAFPSLRRTTCPYCGVGCGVDAKMAFATDDAGKMCSQLVAVSGTPEHPANHGRLCVKGSKLVESNGPDNRLLQPQINGQASDWQTAISKVATGFSDIIAKHGPDAVAFYVSGQLLTEDYYVANKLMKGYIGSANIDTNSRLCMSSAVAGYKRAFGADAVPCCYEDLEQTQLLVFVGSNAAWTHPVLYQRIERAKQLNPAIKVVVIDPRKTATCDLADLHLAIKPGSDAAIFNGLLNYLNRHDALDKQYIQRHTEGFETCLEAAAKWCVECVSEFADVPVNQLRQFYQLYMQTRRSVTFYSMGVNQSSSGVDKSNAIINCHLATGKIGKTGCGPFSITGQPNAMGGREVGGLANMLAAHMDIDNTAHRELVKSFWQSPTIANKPGLKAVDLFQQIKQGKVKAVWIMATNPVVSMPDKDAVAEALQACELVVVSDCVASNDTLAFADVCLPASGWSEKNGTVTNSERRISRQRGLLPPAGEARHDWQIICDVAKHMGYAGFDFQNSCDIFNEHIALSGFENLGRRDFDLSGLGHLSLSQYDNLAPIQWPVTADKPQGTQRLFSDGRFYTASGKAQFVAITPRLPEQQTNDVFPFVLNTGRIRDQWHTMTRTGKVAELNQHTEKPAIHLHPADAHRLSIADGDLVKITARHRQGASDTEFCLMTAVLDKQQRRKDVFVPMHWNREYASHANINRLVAPVADPISGQPELKAAAVAIEPWSVERWATLVTRQPLTTEKLSGTSGFWLKQVLQQGFCYQFAFDKFDEDTLQWLKTLIHVEHSLIRLEQPGLSGWMASATKAESDSQTLTAMLWCSQQPLQNNLAWFNHLLASDDLPEDDIVSTLKHQASLAFQQGKLVCSCFQVREKTIQQAIADGVISVAGLGEKLQCGTNCGSCKSELGSMIKQFADNSRSEDAEYHLAQEVL
ncbi:nitrate reductase [Planctobacterium marinum]|uniref:nitrate reductase n=1 Tax=Planctobacterium marinum TaxID=1631968 RepID=UPI001E42EC07|nr:nitrate reductase [Planctobacterium marinum]MCC2607103.1 nitrate reductase [Planctobacterium marinum]